MPRPREREPRHAARPSRERRRRDERSGRIRRWRHARDGLCATRARDDRLPTYSAVPSSTAGRRCPSRAHAAAEGRAERCCDERCGWGARGGVFGVGGGGAGCGLRRGGSSVAGLGWSDCIRIGSACVSAGRRCSWSGMTAVDGRTCRLGESQPIVAAVGVGRLDQHEQGDLLLIEMPETLRDMMLRPEGI